MKSITLHMKYRGHKSNVKPHVLEQFSGSTGVDFMVRSGFREYEKEKLRFPACYTPVVSS